MDSAGIVCNLSIVGCFVAIRPAPGIGDQVTVSFQLPSWERPLALDSVVSWDNSDDRVIGLPPGCGLAFLEPATADRQQIESVVRASSRRPGRDR